MKLFESKLLVALYFIFLCTCTSLGGRGISKWAAQKGGSVLGSGGSSSDNIVQDYVDSGRIKQKSDIKKELEGQLLHGTFRCVDNGEKFRVRQVPGDGAASSTR